ncbi:MAG: hypothetical protein CSB28_00210 [Desulfobacterales bacterium]|nr:MAG: hypothetical protein CSB28_00210 [Desulfobacterales bacterium]
MFAPVFLYHRPGAWRKWRHVLIRAQPIHILHIYMSTSVSMKDFQEQIQPIRKKIDAIDTRILSLLARRRDEVAKVVSLKKTYQMPVFHPAREAELISNVRDLAMQFRLEPDFIEELYRIILQNSRTGQTRQVEE